MIKLLSSINDDKMRKGIKNKEIAKEINVSEGTVTNYFKGKYIPFFKFVQMVEFIYKNDMARSDNKIDAFLKKTSNQYYQAIQGIEWYFTTGQRDKAEIFIKKHKITHSIVEIYKLLNLRYNGIINKIEYMNKLKNITIDQKDVISVLLRDIALLLGQFDFGAYELVYYSAKELLKNINNLKDEYFRQTFDLRLNDLIAKTLLLTNQLQEARDLCNRIIKKYNPLKFPLPVCTFYSILSESYIMDNYKLSLKYNQAAISILSNIRSNENKMRMLQANHDFINIYYGHYVNLFLTDDSEKAHYYAKIGNKQEALSLLDELKKLNDSPFHLYYESIALNESSLKIKAIEKLYSMGNIFHAKLIQNSPKIS
jgi:transcriptional regulator with XRE-family HTH domain